MTLAEALAEIEAKLAGRAVVALSSEAMYAIRMTGINVHRVKFMVSYIEPTTKTCYVMKTDAAEELRDMVRRELVCQVTTKLTGKAQ